MNNGSGFEIVRTYNLGENGKISIQNDSAVYYTANGVFQQKLPSGLTVHDGELWHMNSNNVLQKCQAELFPSTMLWHGNLIDFDNYNQLWSSMGLSLKNIYSTWRSNPVKIPNHPSYIKNQFKKAFVLMNKNSINLKNIFINYSNFPVFNTFLDFAKKYLEIQMTKMLVK